MKPVQSPLNPNREKAATLITKAEEIADEVVDLAKEAVALDLDPLTETDIRDIARKVGKAADAYLEGLGIQVETK
ncbi:hypothetical protein M1555_02520 [Patescibacteria group bacterium]|nr:hypothetical protein [Patescibacteria group bacterium]